MIDPRLLDTQEDFDQLVAHMLRRGWLKPIDGWAAIGATVPFDAGQAANRVRYAMLRDARKARENHKAMISDLYAAQGRKNTLSQTYGQLRKQGADTTEVGTTITQVTGEIETLERHAALTKDEYETILASLPNISHGPDGVGEDDNVPHQYVGDRAPPADKPVFDFEPVDHVEIGTRMGCLDFEQSAVMSGSRFATLTGPLAKLERVLGQWMLDLATARGFIETAPPHLVKRSAMFGTGQLPKFEDDLFRATAGDGEHFLIPTAEVSLTNLASGVIYEGDPNVSPRNMNFRAMAALTPCYRAEAGSAGRDTRGLMRMHQFNKVELVIVCHPDSAPHAHDFMLHTAEDVLDKLGLNYRTMVLCAGDMGFSAQHTYDIEVWVPSQNRYREIASISNCGDFQARRMNARFKIKGEKGTNFVHTLNGSALAVGRTLLAIMENYQTEDGGIVIPQVLRSRMGGSIITTTGEIV